MQSRCYVLKLDHVKLRRTVLVSVVASMDGLSLHHVLFRGGFADCFPHTRVGVLYS
jgi:hypothetical protein